MQHEFKFIDTHKHIHNISNLNTWWIFVLKLLNTLFSKLAPYLMEAIRYVKDSCIFLNWFWRCSAKWTVVRSNGVVWFILNLDVASERLFILYSQTWIVTLFLRNSMTDYFRTGNAKNSLILIICGVLNYRNGGKNI